MGAMGDPRRRGPAPSGATWTTSRIGAGDATAARSSCSTANISRRASSTRPSVCSGSARSTIPSSRSPTARLQPLDRRLLPRLGRTPGADRAPDAARSRRLRRAELERAVKDGCRGGFVCSVHAHARSRTATPITTCCSRRRASSTCRSASIRRSSRRGRCPCASTASRRESEFFYNVMLRQGVQQAFLSFFALGTLERFPSAAPRRARVGLAAGSAPSSTAWTRCRDDRRRRGVRAARCSRRELLPAPVLHLRRPGRDRGAAHHRSRRRGLLPVGHRLSASRPSEHLGARARALRRAAHAPATRAKVLGENVRRLYGLDSKRSAQ